MAALPCSIYVLREHDMVETSLMDLPDIIDFGLPGLQITSSQFVGIRFVGSGCVDPSPRTTSTVVSDILKSILGAPKGSSGSSHQLFDKELFCFHKEGRRLISQLSLDELDKDSKKSNIDIGGLVNGKTKSVEEFLENKAQHDGMEIQKSNTSVPLSERYPAHSLWHSRFPDTVYQTWEVVWKEGKAAGPLRRQKFVATAAGYQSIQDKIDSWASAAHTNEAMNSAAKAALVACGGVLKENSVWHQVQISSNGNAKGSPRSADQVPEQKHQHVVNTICLKSVQLHGIYPPTCDSKSQILEDSQVNALTALLPSRYRSYNWTLLYSTSRDGISLNTLYRKAQTRGPAILVVRDWQKHVFGCYASEEWKVALKYYGTGECFVFQVYPGMKAYKWTHANSFFMYSNSDMLSMGGGDHYSILLDSELLAGYSGACSTFGSPPLASLEEFDVGLVELWGFQ